jgi:hypothetical protein
MRSSYRGRASKPKDALIQLLYRFKYEHVGRDTPSIERSSLALASNSHHSFFWHCFQFLESFSIQQHFLQCVNNKLGDKNRTSGELSATSSSFSVCLNSSSKALFSTSSSSSTLEGRSFSRMNSFTKTGLESILGTMSGLASL